MSSPSYDELLRQLDEARKEAAYYRNIAKMAGRVRLQETEKLSLLVGARRGAEQRLKVARDELEKRVDERTAELSRANTNLKAEIAERKRAAGELAESENKYRSLFESSIDALSLTQNGLFLDVNPAWLRLHGYTDKSELIGRDVIEIIYPCDRRLLDERRKNWPRVEDRGYAIRDARRDGSAVDVEAHSNSIVLAGQEAILTLVRDVSERKKAEEEKKTLELKLRHSEKMEAIGTLAGLVAHDLNNILSGVVSYPELLLLDVPDDSEFREPLSIIHQSGLKATAVVQDLLTLARRGVSVKAPLHLNRIITDYLKSPEFLKLREFHPEMEILLRLQPDLHPIMGSPVHLAKTVMNLVANAAEAMPNGGKIALSTENRRIKATGTRYRTNRRYTVLRIADTGHGISEQDVRQIFQPFYTKKVMGRSGTGLGMAVVLGTVEDHNGEIDVESREGEGTTFTLSFPASDKAVAETPSAIDIEQYMGSGESVLIVDDVFEQREIASRMLKRLGYCVKAVSSGEEAVEYIRWNTADLVLLDMILDGGLDGLDTYRELLAITPGQKAMIVSGFSETKRVKEAQAHGAVTYVRKPYSIETLARAVRGELDDPTPPRRRQTHPE